MSAAQTLLSGIEAAPEKERSAFDFYPTPDGLALACCAHLDDHMLAIGVDIDGLIIEPSCGAGPFVRAARATWPSTRIRAFDIRPDAAEQMKDSGAEFEVRNSLSRWGGRLPNLIIGNPPYSAAEAHIRCALAQLAPGGTLAFLLRLGFFGSDERVPFFREHPVHALAPIAQRPSFTADGGTDGADYGLFVWIRPWGLETPPPARLLPPIVWKPRSEEQASLFGGQR